MKRRIFFKIAGTFLALASIPLFLKVRKSYYQNILIEPDLLSMFMDDDTLKDLGSAYRKKYPNEDKMKLLTYLEVSNVKNSRLKEHIDGLVSSDFQSGRTVVIDGWILARTEARQCALYSMDQT